MTEQPHDRPRSGHADRRTFLKVGAAGAGAILASGVTAPGTASAAPALELTNASTGDPIQEEKKHPESLIEANDRRTLRQTIMTHLLSEVAAEILASGTSLDGSLRNSYSQGKLPKLRALITDPEREFNRVRDQLYVARDFGSINLVVFRNAMAIGAPPVDVEEVAKRVVIRSGLSGGYRNRRFAGCK